jgi:hypothetical protein
MRSYNTTLDGTGLHPLPSPPPRGHVEYTFRLDLSSSSSTSSGYLKPGQSIPVKRLMANGSDAITGITWDGWSYNYELDQGRPVRLGNVTVGEKVVVEEGGVVRVSVPDASAALLEVGGCFDDEHGHGHGKGNGNGKGGRRRRGRGLLW